MDAEAGTERVRVLLCLHVVSRTGAPKGALPAMGSAVEPFITEVEGGPLAERRRSLGRFRQLTSPETTAPRRSRVRQSLWYRLWSAEVARWRPDVVWVNRVETLRIVERCTASVQAPELLAELRQLATGRPAAGATG